MPIAINGSGSITGLSVGGLPDGIVDADTLATGVGGKVLQVKQTVKTDTFSQSSVTKNTFSNDTGLNVSITPISTSNKIYLSGTVNLSASNQTTGLAIGLFKDGSVISSATGDQSGSNRSRVMHQSWVDTSYTGQIECLPFQFIDSPSTTSSVTYGIRIMGLHSASTSHLYMNQSKSISDDEAYKGMTISVITAMEVAA
tara:strand:- start:215 stop:811 length:597 start_codon:yes stop_codon:yes gene_type:complete